ncbi:MAG: hypothetical protein OXM02_10540 [Bacteroidota bacterium]|nr:hypothetical protein [Bacteroidota bacterium]MDE2956985.1 hypothetical protein [Bacteroidota bacterium]
MGRKGIGKLSAFSIARIVEVHTVEDGQRNAFRMDRQNIEASVRGNRTDEYHPDPIKPVIDGQQSGTRLVLRELNQSLNRAVPHLRRRLARRFSIIGAEHNFEVTVNGEQISPVHRDFHKKLEFVWHFGDRGKAMAEAVGPLMAQKEIGSVVEVKLEDGSTSQHEISGWIGTVNKPDDIDTVNSAMVVMARGKLIHEDLLPEFKEAGVYADYVLGEINADFLDTDEDDIITSGRQSVQEDAPRFRAIVEFVRKALDTVRTDWTALRRERGTVRAMKHEHVQRWYSRLGPDQQKIAIRLFGKIESLRLKDKRARMEIYMASMLAFEKLALTDTLSELDALETPEDFDTLSRLISRIDEIEAVHFYEVTKGRLAVIRKLINSLPEALERVLQKIIFDHLWLLHPTWERAARNGRIEEVVRKEFEGVEAGLSDEEKRGRIDIRYQTAAGKHVIIELKRYKTTITATALVGQLQKYRSALRKCLEAKFPDEPRQIEVIAILGRPPKPDDEPTENANMLRSIDARYITYDQLVLEAERSYREYLEREQRVSDLATILKGVESDFA